MVSAVPLQPLEFCKELGGSALTAVSFYMAERHVVALLGMRSACIRNQRYQITQITCVAHGGANTLVRQQATDNQIFDAKVAQNIMDIG